MNPSEKQSTFDARNGDLVLADGERIGATSRSSAIHLQLESIIGRIPATA
jgi:hypothetical protein